MGTGQFRRAALGRCISESPCCWCGAARAARRPSPTGEAPATCGGLHWQQSPVRWQYSIWRMQQPPQCSRGCTHASLKRRGPGEARAAEGVELPPQLCRRGWECPKPNAGCHRRCVGLRLQSRVPMRRAASGGARKGATDCHGALATHGPQPNAGMDPSLKKELRVSRPWPAKTRPAGGPDETLRAADDKNCPRHTLPPAGAHAPRPATGPSKPARHEPAGRQRPARGAGLRAPPRCARRLPHTPRVPQLPFPPARIPAPRDHSEVMKRCLSASSTLSRPRLRGPSRFASSLQASSQPASLLRSRSPKLKPRPGPRRQA